MIIGLDKPFKPEWVYKILRLAKPGTIYTEIAQEGNYLIEFDGIVAKKKVMTIINRYFLNVKNNIVQDSRLHRLSIRYSYESVKPILLFTLLLNCEVARLIQEKVNLMFGNNGEVKSTVILDAVKKQLGDRTIIRYAVSYYLTILSYFDILTKNGPKYHWKNYKLKCPNHILKEIILLYSETNNLWDLDLEKLKAEVVFSLIDLTNLEDTLREYNSKSWNYQKRLDSNRLIILKEAQ